MEFLRCKMEIFSAKKYDCILITDDIPTKNDSKKYITALGSREAIDLFNIQMAKATSKFAKRKSL
jgi:hypothetical protein